MRYKLAVAALNNIVTRRDEVAGCILHSDRGSQGGFNWSSQHPQILEVFDDDNAAMESFLMSLQNNVRERQTWTTSEELRIEIVVWIERTHHRRRKQDSLSRLTPIEFETIMITPANQVA